MNFKNIRCEIPGNLRIYLGDFDLFRTNRWNPETNSSKLVNFGPELQKNNRASFNTSRRKKEKKLFKRPCFEILLKREGRGCKQMQTVAKWASLLQLIILALLASADCSFYAVVGQCVDTGGSSVERSLPLPFYLSVVASVATYVFSNSELERIFLTYIFILIVFFRLFQNHFLKISKIFVATSQEIWEYI